MSAVIFHGLARSEKKKRSTKNTRSFSSSSHSSCSSHSAFSLLELILFFAILAIMSTTLVGVYISTQEARVRQQGIAALEQRSGQILQSITRTTRRAEKILYPAAGQTSGFLVLQMAQNEWFPTIFTASGGKLAVVEKATIAMLANDNVRLSNLTFTNIGNSSVVMGMDMTFSIELPVSLPYKRHFDAAVTLFPVGSAQAGGCDCSAQTPACVGGYFRWHYCDATTCTLTGGTALRCQ